MGKIFEALKKAGFERTDLLARSYNQRKKSKSADDYDLSKAAETEKPVLIKTESYQHETKIEQSVRIPEEIVDYSDIVDEVQPDEPIASPQAKKTISPASIRSIFAAATGRCKAVIESFVKAFPDEVETELITIANPESFTTEQFKVLRTNLLFPRKGPIARSILVTSTLPGEGKSFVSANLSVSIAQSIKERVLLIDCDLRRPRINRMFGLDDAAGLSEYLNNGYDISSIICPTSLEKLTVIQSCRIPPNPSELLSSEKMSDLMAKVKARYEDRYIIIDSPPPQLTAETMVLSRQVDGILLVVKGGSTKRELIKKVVDQLGRDKILGIVFNNFEIGASSYYSYNNKYYNKMESTSRRK